MPRRPRREPAGSLQQFFGHFLEILHLAKIPFADSISRLAAIRRTALHRQVCSGFVQPQPAQRDRARERGAVLVRRPALLEERAVDQLNVDAAILYRLARVGDLYQLAGGGVRVGEVARLNEFRRLGLP